MEKKKEIASRLHQNLARCILSGTKNLVGELLTITDSISSDSVQRKALKNLVENTTWRSHSYLVKDLEWYTGLLAKAIGEEAPVVLVEKVKSAKEYNPLTD